MAMLVACKCGKKLNVREELAGKKIKCPACGSVVVAAASESIAEVAPPPKATSKPPAMPGVKGGPPPLKPLLKQVPPPVEEAAPEVSADVPLVCEGRREFTSGLVVVGDDAIWFGRLKDKELRRAQKEIEAGTPIDEVLDEEAFNSRIELEDILGINFNKHHKQIEVQHPGKTESDEKETSTFYFDDHATRDDVFKDLRCRLGKGWKYERRDLNALQAMWAPIGTIGLVILVFGFFVFLAWAFNQPADEGGRVRIVRTNLWGIIIAYTVGWIGPWWTGGIGMAGVVICFVWMFVRMATPPIEISLKPRAEDDEEDDQEDDRPRKKKRRRQDDAG